MGYQMFALFPKVAAFRHHGHDGVIALVGLHVGQQHNHGDVTGNGEDIDRCRRLLSDIDLLVRYVIAYGKRLWGGKWSTSCTRSWALGGSILWLC